MNSTHRKDNEHFPSVNSYKSIKDKQPPTDFFETFGTHQSKKNSHHMKMAQNIERNYWINYTQMRNLKTN
jgi:hypothetical protein